jgi:hypothetical protein
VDALKTELMALVPEHIVDARLRQLGAPLFGSLQRKRERLARFEHYAFKRVVDEQAHIAATTLLKLKTDFGDPEEFVSVPTTNGHHGFSSLH